MDSLWGVVLAWVLSAAEPDGLLRGSRPVPVRRVKLSPERDIPVVAAQLLQGPGRVVYVPGRLVPRWHRNLLPPRHSSRHLLTQYRLCLTYTLCYQAVRTTVAGVTRKVSAS